MSNARARHLPRIVRTATALFAITLAMLVGAELLARLVMGPAEAGDVGSERAEADVYAGSDWAPAYYAEFALANRTAWRPYVYWRRRPFQGRFINIDESGIRRTWRAPDAGPGARRVFLFGGSTMWGTGARDDGTIASYLAKKLAARGLGGVEVVNLGEGGYVSMQEVILLADLLRRGEKPEVAVFLDGINDVFAAYQSGQAGWPQNEANRVREFNIDVDRRIYSEALGVFLRGLALTRLLTPTPPPPAAAGAELEPLVRAAIETYVDTVALARALGEQNGFATLFYWQPVLFSKGRRTAYEEKVAGRPEVPRQLFTAAYAAAPSILAGTPVRDLSGVFGDDPAPAYIDFCHLGEPGNEVVAEAMAGDVAAALGAGS